MKRRWREVREHLFAGDFYQANLTFGCDVAVAGDPLALYARLRRSSAAGWGGVVRHDERRAPVAVARAILHHPRRRDRGQADEGHRAAPRRSAGRRGRGGGAGGRPQAARRKSDDRRSDAQRPRARRRDRAASRCPSCSRSRPFRRVHQMVSRITARLRDGRRRGRRAARRSSRAGRSPARPRSRRSRRCAGSSPSRAAPTPGRWGGSSRAGMRRSTC